MEEGMTYVVDHGGKNKFLFRLSTPSNNNDVQGKVMSMSDDSSFYSQRDTEITILHYPIRRATVEEDIWFEECEKEKRKITKEEALAKFN